MSTREHVADVHEAVRGARAFDHLRTDHTILVPGEGASRPKVLIVGGAPGAMENTTRRPFTGANGLILRSLITDVALLDPADYYLTTLLKYRTPGGRLPTHGEIAAAVPFLRREYAALGSPAVIVAVGDAALRALSPPHTELGTLSHGGSPIALPGGRALWPMISTSAAKTLKAQDVVERHWTKFGEWFREEFR